MAVFELEKDGEVYEIEAPTQEAAIEAFSSIGAQSPQTPAQPQDGQRKGLIGGLTQALSGGGFFEAIPVVGASLEKMPANVQENVVSAAANVPSGATFGFADEIAGVVNPQAKDTLRGLQDATRQENPVSSLVGQVGGGLMTGGAIASNPLGKKAVEKAGYYGSAALGGGAYGAGEADGGFIDRLKGGAYGAAFGVATAGLLQKVGVPVVNAAWQKIKSGANDRLTKAEAQAWRILKGAAKKDGIDDIGAHIAKIAKEDDTGRMVFETGGPNMKRLAVGLGGDEGAASTKMIEALTARQERQKPFIQSKLKSIFKTDDFAKVKTDLGNSFSKIGSPLYKKVTPLPMQRTPELGSILTRPGMDKVLKKAAANAARKGEKLQPDTVGFYHNLKLAVDDMASNKGSIGNAKRETAASWKAISDQLVEQIEKQAPDYKTARTFWRGKKADEAALEYGQKALSSNVYVEDIADAVSKMSESEKAFFKAGLFRKARVMTNNPSEFSGNSAQPFANANIREKLQAVLDPKEARQTLKLFDDISEQVNNRRVIDRTLGSPTATRQEGAEALKTNAEKVLGGGANVVMKPKTALENLLSTGASKVGKMPEKTKVALAELLTKNPELIKDVPQSVLVQISNISATKGLPIGAGANMAIETFVKG